jgi:hypothetical protein
MKFLSTILPIIAILIGGYFYFDLGEKNALDKTVSVKTLPIHLHNIREDWPRSASAKEPIVLVNHVALYKNSLQQAFMKATTQLKSVEVFKEAILTELRRQVFLSESTLSEIDKAKLKAPTQSNISWLLTTNKAIHHLLVQRVRRNLKSPDVNPLLPPIDPSLLKPTKLKIATIRVYYKSNDQIQRLLIDQKINEIHTRLVKYKISFDEAQRLYSELRVNQPNYFEIYKGAQNKEEHIPTSILDRLFSSSVGSITEPIKLDDSTVIFKVIEQYIPIQDTQDTQRDAFIKRQKKHLSDLKQLLTKTALKTALIEVPNKALTIARTKTSQFIPLILTLPK